MAASFGLHFGSTSACIAVSNDGKIDVLADDAGHRVMPCIVAFTDHEQMVGASAKQGLIRNSENTVCNVRQLIGRTMNDPEVKAYQSDQSVKVAESESHNTPVFSVRFKEQTTLVNPVDVATSIFKKMHETARSHGAGGTTDVVVTVPLEFSPEQKNLIQDAVGKAGMNVLRVISEPSAAILAYDIGQTDIHDGRNVLVVRVGGTSTAVTVVSILNGLYRVLSSVTSATGGHEYTRTITDQLIVEFKRKHRHDISGNQRALMKLKMAAETCKHGLSRQDNCQVAIDSLYDGSDMDANMSRMRFDNAVLPLVQQCLRLIGQAISDAHTSPSKCLTKEQINKVVLCGGGTNVQVLQKAIIDYLPHAVILSSIPPEEVIAIGAAKEASILAGSDQDEIDQHEIMNEIDASADTIFYSVSDCVHDGETTGVVFYRHTPLPARKQMSYTLQHPHDLFVLNISINDDIGEPVPTSKLTMHDLPTGATIRVTYHLRREGSLHIVCTEQSTNKEKSITIDAAPSNQN